MACENAGKFDPKIKKSPMVKDRNVCFVRFEPDTTANTLPPPMLNNYVWCPGISTLSQCGIIR